MFTDTRDINRNGVILADATQSDLSATQPVLLIPLPALRVDTNSDGVIDANDSLPTASQPFQHWLNAGTSAGLTGGNGTPVPDYASGTVNGTNDLNNYFPVFLDIQNFVSAMPPGKGYTYWLSQADEALDLVYTNLTQQTAFAYRGGLQTTGFWPDLSEAPGAADKEQVTAGGVQLSASFLNLVQSSTTNQGVLLFEGRTPSTAPLVLTVYDGYNNQVLQVSLQLSLGARILLLLHGMNSSTDAWTNFVHAAFHGSSQDIVNGDFYPTSSSLSPSPNSHGVYCYRLQFGHYDNSSSRTGLEGLTATTAMGFVQNIPTPYLNDPHLTCGDFETFDELGQEVDDAITKLKTRYGSNAEIVLVGHSRGGISARAFLESSSTNRASVVALLTTSSPHQGSPLLRIYAWLGLETDPTTGNRVITTTNAASDWNLVDGLRNSATVNLDLRRPVIGDLSDRSTVLNTLNTAIASLPTGIRYGEITYSGVNLGVLALHPWGGYSVFDGKLALWIDPLPEISAQYLLYPNYSIIGSANKTAAEVDYTGDGCVPVTNQRFSTLLGFVGTKVPPLAKNIPPLVLSDGTIVHTEAPHQSADLIKQLKVLVPDWLP